MANSSPSEYALNALLTQHAFGYRSVGTVGQRLLTRIPTDQQYDSIGLYSKASWLRPQSTLKTPGEAPKSSSFEMSLTSYSCLGYQHGGNCTVELLDATEPVDLLLRAAERVSDALNLDSEIRMHDRCWTGCGRSLVLSGAGAFTSPLSSFVSSAPHLHTRQSWHRLVSKRMSA